MRWEGQLTENDAQGRLPGMEEPPVVRTFDAPEAVGIQFHEVQARSALNSVPPMARLGFSWTINPYRGCTHACSYCLDPGTPVLMLDGTQRPIAELGAGDRVYGTVRRGRYRRYVPSRVEAVWRTRKRAFRITLHNGQQLVASGDHRFLTERGWKFVDGAEQGRARRPHLTTNNRLLGFGDPGAAPEHDEAYRRGYLCGMIRGDGSIGSYEYPRRGGRLGRVHRFRLALADREALERSRSYLAAFGVDTHRFRFSRATESRREVNAIRASAGDAVESCRRLCAWPHSATAADRSWVCGFLAGIFDAEGSHSRGVMRIRNTDPEIIRWVADSCHRFGIETVTESRSRTGRPPMLAVRVVGGVRSRMRFLTRADPAIARKRRIDGLAVKGRTDLGIAEIEPLPGRLRMYDIQTSTGDFIAGGVISHNCFARPTHRYLDLDPREDFERQIVVKVNLPEVLRAELRRPSWKGEHVALGTNTDPYQWVEGRYRITRGIWERLLEARNPCSILTKSPLLLRDLDLFQELSARTEFRANLSIPTLDEKAWRLTEPGTPHPRKRIEAVAELKRAGIEVGVLVAPLMPGINDSPEQVAELLRLCGEAGADSIGGIGLHLRGELKEIFFDWLTAHRPDLLPRYRRLYARGGNLPAAERKRFAGMVGSGGARRRDGSAASRGGGSSAAGERTAASSGSRRGR